MKVIDIPQKNSDCWDGTTGVTCQCGGLIEWAEAAYVPGTRACRRCLTMFAVRGKGGSRRLVPQGSCEDNVIGDIGEDDEPYTVPENLYPGWHVPA